MAAKQGTFPNRYCKLQIHNQSLLSPYAFDTFMNNNEKEDNYATHDDIPQAC